MVLSTLLDALPLSVSRRSWAIPCPAWRDPFRDRSPQYTSGDHRQSTECMRSPCQLHIHVLRPLLRHHMSGRKCWGSPRVAVMFCHGAPIGALVAWPQFVTSSITWFLKYCLRKNGHTLPLTFSIIDRKPARLRLTPPSEGRRGPGRAAAHHASARPRGIVDFSSSVL